MPRKKARRPDPVTESPSPPEEPAMLPMTTAPGGGLSTSQFAEIAHTVIKEEPTVAPRSIARGLILFDLDGTILDDIGLIADVAADVLHRAFGTPTPEGRLHYLATTGMPFEAQLAQLFPDTDPHSETKRPVSSINGRSPKPTRSPGYFLRCPSS